MNEKFCLLFRISLKFDPKSLIDNTPELVQVMAGHQIGTEPLSEPMMTHFFDAFMQH